MSQSVREIILAPMQEMYLPPPHLRHNAPARARAIALYERTLASFDADTLQRAWQKIVAKHTSWGTWPNPATIAQACRQCQPRPISPPTEEQLKAKAFALADDYATGYMKTSHLAKLAQREGWSGRLREYVTDAAWVQAQLICAVRNIGWNARLAEGLGRFHSSAEAFAAYRKTIEKHIEHAKISVEVPPVRIQHWQKQCRQAREIMPTASC